MEAAKTLLNCVDIVYSHAVILISYSSTLFVRRLAKSIAILHNISLLKPVSRVHTRGLLLSKFNESFFSFFLKEEESVNPYFWGMESADSWKSLLCISLKFLIT
jgi:hypothetical protein